MSLGILTERQIKKLNTTNGPLRVSRPSNKELEFNTSSIDLPLGKKFWKMKGSCRTGEGMQIRDLVQRYAIDPKPKEIIGNMELKRNTVYLFELDCELNLSNTSIQGKATARSSIGRLDVMVRLVTPESSEFDRIPEGYNHSGPLYTEVTPISFNIEVRLGTSLSQLRLFKGTDRLITLTQEEFKYEDKFPVVVEDIKFSSTDTHETWYPFRLNLERDRITNNSGFMAKKDPPYAIDPMKKEYYNPKEFWEPVVADQGSIYLEPNRLYILRSKERLKIPGHMALECQAYTETMGEWRIEYAGFAHPYFGCTRDKGSPLMFEVRGHNIPTILTDGIQLGNVCFKRMAEKAEEPEDKSQYEEQELKLSGCFKTWS